jgi:dinuclear metal center YbgI/SA1388 family protein
MMNRDDLVAYLDNFLQTKDIDDKSNNGLQVEGDPHVSRVALAVDAGLAAFAGAQAAGAEMLIVHHGLFWGEPIMVTSIHRRRLGQLFDAGLSLYASHLPLDFHPELGNNATLARWLELEEVAPFGDYKGQPAGVEGRLPGPIPLDRFSGLVQETLGEHPTGVWAFGPDEVQQVGIVSGGAGFLVGEAARAGVDVYLTGEVSHGVFHEAQELGLNVIYGGHYATETAGLKALGEHLTSSLGLETAFLDLPTGA